jgi:hypothetical protein
LHRVLRPFYTGPIISQINNINANHKSDEWINDGGSALPITEFLGGPVPNEDPIHASIGIAAGTR